MKKKECEYALYYNKVVSNIKSIAAQNGDTNTISQISQKVKIPKSTLTDKFNNPRKINLEDLVKISCGLNVKVEELFL